MSAVVRVNESLSLIRIVSLHGHLDHVSTYDKHFPCLIVMDWAHCSLSNTMDNVSEIAL